MELLHVLGAFLRLTAKLSGAPNFTKKRKAYVHGHYSLKLLDHEARPLQRLVRRQAGKLLAAAECARSQAVMH